MNGYPALLLLLSIGGAFAEELPAEHTVRPKDTLWDLAGRYYHDPFQWPQIAEANPPPGVRDPHWIYPKQVLHIPVPQAAPQAAPKEAPEALPSPEPVQAPAPKPLPPPAERPALRQDRSPGMEQAAEGLSDDFPSDIVGQPPAMVRFKAEPGWKPDGVVLDNRQDEGRMSSEEDLTHVRIDAAQDVRVGDRYQVLRRSAPTDADEDRNAAYLSKLGLLEIRRHVSGGTYRALILRSSDAVQPGDMIKRGE